MPNLFQKIFGFRDDRLPTVPVPPGYPKIPVPARPKVRGLNPVEQEAALATYYLQMRSRSAAIARFQRECREKIGLTKYKWLAATDACCAIGIANNGCVFTSTNPPKEGHPCEGECTSKDWCRCIAVAVIKGFD